jgi:arylsulfatase
MNREEKPNILFIMADQLRADYLGCDGATWVDTPHIDSIAAKGTLFKHCYTNSPVCAPARIALATGMRPHRIGALDNQAFLPAGARTYYQRVRDQEYYVGCSGKLDLAKPDQYNGLMGDRPCNFGFGFTHPIEVEGKIHAGCHPEPFGPYSSYLHSKGLLERFREDFRGRGYFGADDSALETEDWHDVYIGCRAVQWLEERPKDYPYHMFVSFAGPHDPFDPPKEYADKYRNREMPPRVIDSGEGKPQRVKNRMVMINKRSEEELLHLRRQYCAAIAAIDDMVGEIIAAAEARNDGRETYIIFSADHGEMMCDHSLPIKHQTYEPSWRVPLIISGPGLPEGEVSDALVELIDVGETVADIAGSARPDNIDAHSLLPLLRGETKEHRDHVITMERPYRSIRTKRWKLTENYNDATELYDMENDPDELSNVIGENREVAGKLKKMLTAGMMEDKWRRG